MASLGSNFKVAAIDAASSGANTLIAGAAGKTIRVYRIVFSLASGTIIFKDGSTALSGAMTLTSLVLESQNDEPLFVTTAGSHFVATLSGANQLSGTIWYTQS